MLDYDKMPDRNSDPSIADEYEKVGYYAPYDPKNDFTWLKEIFEKN